eukprot:CAMPEP_0168348498 /NCGR_PEP_ID=MMETSP0213-20121227/19779_1 /TAXON_ID=151035 /ORGANISM="Euplotes harpa, Strain FSP1.4" /LENGTH=328 /DNA_ID=CAMNT_0008358105 /DNA_START=233 /DNA_END=1217 /DNA_ORIENTATION=-
MRLLGSFTFFLFTDHNNLSVNFLSFFESLLIEYLGLFLFLLGDESGVDVVLYNFDRHLFVFIAVVGQISDQLRHDQEISSVCPSLTLYSLSRTAVTPSFSSPLDSSLSLALFLLFVFSALLLHHLLDLFGFLWAVASKLDLHFGPFDGEDLGELLDEHEGLLLLVLVLLHAEVDIVHGLEDHWHWEGNARFFVHSHRAHDVRDFELHAFELRFPLEIRDLHLPFLEDDLDGLVFVFVQQFGHVLRFGDLSFADVGEDFVDLEDLVDVGLHVVSPVLDLVLVSGDFELVAVDFVPHHGDVGQSDLALRRFDHGVLYIYKQDHFHEYTTP